MISVDECYHHWSRQIAYFQFKLWISNPKQLKNKQKKMLVKDQHVQGTVMNIEVHSQYHWLTSYSKCKLWTMD